MGAVLDMERVKEFQEDVKYLHSNYNDLINKFDKQFVAIKKQEVIEHDKDLDRLKEKITQRGIEPTTTLVEFIRDKRNELD